MHYEDWVMGTSPTSSTNCTKNVLTTISAGLREAATHIEHDLMQTLADELKVDTTPMMIPYDGNFAAELGYR